MTKKERAAVLELYREALRINHHATSRAPRSVGFRDGYEWGIAQTLEKLGIDEGTRWDIWNEITKQPPASNRMSEQAQAFDSMSEAFDFCREADRPVTVIVSGKRWQLYPSGRAEPLSPKEATE